MITYDIFVKGNLEWSDPVPVRILSRNPLSENTINTIKTMRLTEAQAYCQRVLKVTIMIGHPKEGI